MQIHTFRAESLQAALQQVRRQLGPDAAILQTREKRSGRLGIFAKPVIEVEATLGPANFTAAEVESHPVRPALSPSVSSEQPASLERIVADGRLASSEQPSEQVPIGAISRVDVGQQRVVQQRVGEKELENQRLAEQLKVSGAIGLSTSKPHVVALVGPTGCGKTTSLAKIASNFRFERGCHVGLVALDNFRLGAVDQLLHYADMLSAPLEVVSSAEQVPAALQRLRNCDLVLIDTAGRAPRDSVHLADLGKFLQLARPQSIQLVVSASSSTAHVSQTMERFSSLQPTDLLITKLDEAADFESWSTLLKHTPLPISYLTHGQRVPLDITPATNGRLASLLLGQPQHVWPQDSLPQDFQQQVFPREGSLRAPDELELSN